MRVRASRAALARCAVHAYDGGDRKAARSPAGEMTCGIRPSGPGAPGRKGAAVRLQAALVALWMVGAAQAAPARAQERPGAVYVAAGVAAVRQDGAADGDFQIYITAPGGTTPGWAVAAGVFVRAWLSIEGELSTTGTFHAREPARYGMTYREERRDRLIGALVRLHIRPGRRLDIEPVGGVAAVRHDRWSQAETYRSWLPPDQAVEIGPRIRSETLTGLAAIGGIDIRAGGRHVALVPSFRARVSTRGDRIEWYYPGGFPRWTLAAGVYARVDF